MNSSRPQNIYFQGEGIEDVLFEFLLFFLFWCLLRSVGIEMNSDSFRYLLFSNEIKKSTFRMFTISTCGQVSRPVDFVTASIVLYFSINNFILYKRQKKKLRRKGEVGEIKNIKKKAFFSFLDINN